MVSTGRNRAICYEHLDQKTQKEWTASHLRILLKHGFQLCATNVCIPTTAFCSCRETNFDKVAARMNKGIRGSVKETDVSILYESMARAAAEATCKKNRKQLF